MPNQLYCVERGTLKMGDISLLYSSPKCEEKICKYSYASWCPTCEKNSPRRRRSRSETNEPCRRRSREMKTFTPKKYNIGREYENMDLDYDVKDCWYEGKEYRGDIKDARYDCCRIRSNLCELPTTYISNNCQTPITNCQVPTNISNLSKMSVNDRSDFVNCIQKNVKTYEQTLKFVDINNQIEHFDMSEKSRTPKIGDRVGHKDDVDSIHYFSNKLNYEHRRMPSKLAFSPDKPIPSKSKVNSYFSNKQNDIYNLEVRNHKEYTNDNHRSNIKSSSLPKNSTSPLRNSCHLHCKLVDLKCHALPNKNTPMCYDTCTFFDKKLDIGNLRESYTKEIDLLREQLISLKRNLYSNSESRVALEINEHNTISFIEKDNKVHKVHSRGDITVNKKETIEDTVVPIENIVPDKSTVVNNKSKIIENKSFPVRRERKGIISPPLIKSVKPKVALKTRNKITSAKFRKVKPKVTTDLSVNSDFFETELSASDESEEDTNICDDESESTSEPSSTDLQLCRDIALSGSSETLGWPARASLFPNIPPYIRFNTHDADVSMKMPNGKKYFKWKLSTITPVVVRKTLTNSGFSLVRKSNQWLGTWGKHMKSPLFKTLKETQKFNHFPGTFQLGRKDRLWRNFQRLINRFGLKEFGFLPHTYILPQELRLLKQNWEFKNGSGGEMWIIKPPASARGVGIKVINKWSQLPKKLSLVVQKYISSPYLINGSKFDLRLYVLVTSFDPLRIYLYPEGLARFASVKYSEDAKDLKDRYMHLTNYSINKLSSQYTPNEDADACHGHKWTLSKLFEYMQEQNVDTKALWKKLEQLVIKTMITCEAPISQLSKENMNNRYNCYELFGVDVLLDENLKPWLLEVNISPSLHSASPLDAHVKGPLVQTLFNLVQFHFPPRLTQTVSQSPKCYDPRLYTTSLTKKERQKHEDFEQYVSRLDYIPDILNELTGDDVRHLTQAEDEFVVKGTFDRIFPTSHTHKYLHFMETRYYNRLFDAWETTYEKNRQAGIDRLKLLCAEKVHLRVGPSSNLNKNSQNMNHGDTNQHPEKAEQNCYLTAILQEAAQINSSNSN